jgi:hypothetical protein
VLRIRMCGVTPPLSHTSAWLGAWFILHFPCAQNGNLEVLVYFFEVKKGITSEKLKKIN